MHLQSLSFRSLAICIPKPFIFHPGTPKGFLGSPESKINHFFSQVIYQTLKCTSVKSTQSSLHQLTNSTFCVSRYLPTFLDLFQRFGGKLQILQPWSLTRSQNISTLQKRWPQSDRWNVVFLLSVLPRCSRTCRWCRHHVCTKKRKRRKLSLYLSFWEVIVFMWLLLMK